MKHHPYEEQLRHPKFSKPKPLGLYVVGGLAIASLVTVLFSIV